VKERASHIINETGQSILLTEPFLYLEGRKDHLFFGESVHICTYLYISVQIVGRHGEAGLHEVEGLLDFGEGFGSNATLGEEFRRFVEPPRQNGAEALPVEEPEVDLFRVIMRA
jgi:hypothetical protein